MIDSAMKRRIDTLAQNRDLPDADLAVLLEHLDRESAEYLYEAARKVRHEIYGREVYLRGLIEFTNVCKNDCYYCGIRRSNQNAQRYRLREQEILDCCKRAMRWASGRLCSRAARTPGIPTSGCAIW